ncbi:MAG: type II secretion system protein [Ruminococcus sp.]|nr:type II secretion system protein [Ruminococcus sp.]
MKKLMERTMKRVAENKKNGKKSLKGFTLVEIIVVLVILAILAAAMIPALTGYIDKARDRTDISEARNALTAAQTLASEAYGLGKEIQTGASQSQTTTENDGGYDAGYSFDNMETLAECSGNITSITVNDKNKITAMTYVVSDEKTINYTSATGFTVTKTTGSSGT